MKQLRVLAGTALVAALVMTSCGEKALTPEQIKEKATAEFTQMEANLAQTLDSECQARMEAEVAAKVEAMMANPEATTPVAETPATEAPAAEGAELTDEQKIVAAVTAMKEEFTSKKKAECDAAILAKATSEVETKKAEASKGTPSKTTAKKEVKKEVKTEEPKKDELKTSSRRKEDPTATPKEDLKTSSRRKPQ